MDWIYLFSAREEKNNMTEIEMCVFDEALSHGSTEGVRTSGIHTYNLPHMTIESESKSVICDSTG